MKRHVLRNSSLLSVGECPLRQGLLCLCVFAASEGPLTSKNTEQRTFLPLRLTFIFCVLLKTGLRVFFEVMIRGLPSCFVWRNRMLIFQTLLGCSERGVFVWQLAVLDAVVYERSGGSDIFWN